ncbi:MAG: LpqN/LpqT family lipoprotein [Mycobacterium sp.]
MSDNTRNWRVLLGSFAASLLFVVGVLGTSAPAAADPTAPQPNVPPTTVTAPVAAATAPVLAPAASGTLRDFFHERDVTLESQVPQGFTALNIVVPLPPGWAQVPDPNVPDAFVVLADKGGGDLYTANAQLVVYKLLGEFDSHEAITHGFIDSQLQEAWQSTDASLADFGGFPSALIEGTYRSNGVTLNASRRHVIAQSGTDRYLLTLTVTTTTGQAVAAAGATDGILNGFQVTDPAAPPAPATVAESSTPVAPVPLDNPVAAALPGSSA